MEAGTLYIVATPIGNLEDITCRAVRILKEVNAVYCEDTRQTGKLLAHYGISAPKHSLHAHSADRKTGDAVERLKRGESLAYMTDAGTPALSDPGSLLVRAARDAEIPVVPLPGPSALAALISVSGFTEKRILFAGFLSKKEGKMRRELDELRKVPGIIVLYESPYRIKKLLKILAEEFPESRVVIGREMTKVYEEFIAGTAQQLYKNSDSMTEKGEFTVAIENSRKNG